MNNSAQSDAESSIKARRKLLKAAAAAPLVATLAPNSALAMSSAVQCAMRDSNQTYSDVVPRDHKDGAVRRKANLFVKTPHSPEHLPQQVYKIREQPGRFLSDGTPLNEKWSDISEFYERQKVDVLELFEVDEFGISQQGSYPSFSKNNGATPLSVSCWNSIDPDAFMKHNV